MAREVQRQRSGPAEEGRRKRRLEGQGQQNMEKHSDRTAGLGGERKWNKSYLDAVKNGYKNEEHLSAGDQPKVGRKEDQIYDQDSVIGSTVGARGAGDRQQRGKRISIIRIGRRRGGCGFYEEATTLIEEEGNLNGNSEATYNKLGKGNIENIEKDNQAHQANGGGIYCGLGGEYVGAQHVGLDGKVVEIHKAGAESEGFNNGTDGLQKLKAGKGSAGLGEGMKSKENMVRNSTLDVSG
ncbi:hypothetical protein L6452_03208 [Arctium lappa]|uniref:Uncharacterized protein n=1 Tax=Arctium lappa TaxID=4217 RepID=A0ACB9FL85_ARCLA|nr:hypothetical protein L6452_03208 [Arctium lappa]